MSANPFMQLYVGDYLADTLDLTTEQHGAYLLLLMTMWRHDAKLPNDPAKLARIARVSLRRWHLVWGEIQRLFEVEGDQITSGHIGRWEDMARRDSIRPAIPTSVKQDVLAGRCCTYCGVTSGPFEIDHIVPWSRGGTHDRENLTLACKPCNRSKRDKTPEEWMQ